MELNQTLRELVLSAGGDYFGVADLRAVRNMPLERGAALVVQFPFAITIGVKLPDTIVDRLVDHPGPDIVQEYKRIYDQTNAKLDEIGGQVVTRLQATGAAALAIPASRKVDAERLYSDFSHKMAAHLAGLGWIGRSCLLITPEHGPRVRWATVLTDAALNATGHAREQACGTCRRCVELCPAQAFTGRPFQVGEPRDLRFAACKCRDYRAALDDKMGCTVLCGICVCVCPHGGRGNRAGL